MTQKFKKLYDMYRNDISLSSIDDFERESFKDFVEPNNIPLNEFIECCRELLDQNCIDIVNVLDKRFEAELGEPLIEYHGFVTLSEAAEKWKEILNFLDK